MKLVAECPKISLDKCPNYCNFLTYVPKILQVVKLVAKVLKILNLGIQTPLICEATMPHLRFWKVGKTNNKILDAVNRNY
jgi:hypothetical protein